MRTTQSTRLPSWLVIGDWRLWRLKASREKQTPPGPSLDAIPSVDVGAGVGLSTDAGAPNERESAMVVRMLVGAGPGAVDEMDDTVPRRALGDLRQTCVPKQTILHVRSPAPLQPS